MEDTLITTRDLSAPRRALLAGLGLSLAAGIAAFLITWLVLAWPTVQLELKWYFGHRPATTLQPKPGQTTPTIDDNHVVISAIGVSAPIIYDTDITDAVGKLPDGVVHVRDTAYPGDSGNTFLIGHSSGYWWQDGPYNQVFALLDKVKVGDQILVNRNGQTFEYRVTATEIVSPSKVDVLDQPTDKRMLSIMTCTPVGTSINRLIVHAELVNHDSAQALSAERTLVSDLVDSLLH